MSALPDDTRPAGADPPWDSDDWVRALGDEGPRHEDAVARLHALLLRAARFEIGRRSAALDAMRGEALDDLAMQAADDALVALMAKLGSFRGDSRFTTWAYKFALLEASVKVRRRAWRDREVPLTPEQWDVMPDAARQPPAAAEDREFLAAVRRAIADGLTNHQRDVLVALTMAGVPIDVLAERLGSTRGALYKTLHDARRKLRARLADDGFPIEPQKTAEEEVTRA